MSGLPRRRPASVREDLATLRPVADVTMDASKETSPPAGPVLKPGERCPATRDLEDAIREHQVRASSHDVDATLTDHATPAIAAAAEEVAAPPVVELLVEEVKQGGGRRRDR